MNKVLDFITSIGINMFVFGLWAYKMLVMSDIPVEMSYSEALSISFFEIKFNLKGFNISYSGQIVFSIN